MMRRAPWGFSAPYQHPFPSRETFLVRQTPSKARRLSTIEFLASLETADALFWCSWYSQKHRPLAVLSQEGALLGATDIC